MLRIFTCTPVDFRGDGSFFSRDSGLFSRGLRANGVESMAIMPGPTRPDDFTDQLIRTDPANLISSEWWKDLRIDGLVLYSWASPRFTSVAKAVMEAGIPSLVVMDTSGVISPWANSQDWRKESFSQRYYERSSWIGMIKGLASDALELITHRVSKARQAHYEAASAIGVVTPLAARWVRQEIRRLSPSQELDEKVIYLPHPQLDDFRYDGRKKQNLIVSVGRWGKEDWGQKNPRLLLDALDLFLEEYGDWEVKIVGREATRLSDRFPSRIGSDRSRITFLEHVNSEELISLFNDSRIGIWSSRWEGQQGTAAQALCCGNSVVAPFSGAMSCFRHYISRESGRLAGHFDPVALCDELCLEAESWLYGQRDATRISEIWCEEFHAREVAGKALQILNLL